MGIRLSGPALKCAYVFQYIVLVRLVVESISFPTAAFVNLKLENAIEVCMQYHDC